MQPLNYKINNLKNIFMNMKKYWMLKKNEIEHKYQPENWRLEDHGYKEWFAVEESNDTTLEDNEKEKLADLPPIPPLEEDKEKVKEGAEVKMLNLNKLLTRTPVILAQIKAGINS